MDTKPGNKGPEYRIIAHSSRDPLPRRGVVIAKFKKSGGWKSGGWKSDADGAPGMRKLSPWVRS